MFSGESVFESEFRSAEPADAPSFTAYHDSELDGRWEGSSEGPAAATPANEPMIHNAIVRDLRIADEGLAWTLVARLRVTLEIYEANECVAYLVEDSSFAGHGDDARSAIADLIELIAHDLRFYRATPDAELTQDAIRTKAMLGSLFAEVSAA